MTSPGLCVLISGGCASLDAKSDMQRSAAFVQRVTGVSSALLLLDAQTAKDKTSELLQGGVSSDEAVQVALLNNPRARAAMLSIGVSRADFVQSTLFSNPSLALAFRFPEGGGLANFGTALTQNIAELWLIPARKEVAQRGLDRTVLQAANAIAAIAYDARRAYTRAARSRQEESILSDTLGIAERLQEVAELRRQAGAGNEIDVNLARTKKLEAETTLRNARLATLEAQSDLARVLGIPDAPSALQLTESLPQPHNWSISADALLRVAGENRLDLQIVEQSLAEAEARVKEQRVRYMKSVHIGYALERGERRSGEASNGSDVIAGPTLDIELPLWDRNQAQITKAERLLEQLLRIRDAMFVDVAQDIHSRLARARTGAENAMFYRDKQLPAAKRNVALSREAYKGGRLSFLSVLEAERTYLAARSGYLDAVEGAALATVELERVTGRPASFLRAIPVSTNTDQEPQDLSNSEVKP